MNKDGPSLYISSGVTGLCLWAVWLHTWALLLDLCHAHAHAPHGHAWIEPHHDRGPCRSQTAIGMTISQDKQRNITKCPNIA